MLKVSLILVMLSSLVFGFFMPSFSFGGGNSDKIDTNFERDDRTEIVLDKKESKIYYDGASSSQMNFEDAQVFCKKVISSAIKSGEFQQKRSISLCLSSLARI